MISHSYFRRYLCKDARLIKRDAMQLHYDQALACYEYSKCSIDKPYLCNKYLYYTMEHLACISELNIDLTKFEGILFKTDTCCFSEYSGAVQAYFDSALLLISKLTCEEVE